MFAHIVARAAIGMVERPSDGAYNGIIDTDIPILLKS
ncbi:MAG: hypothetical protein RIS36_1942 [Pseudomonadota bacterium]|jgi:hypothetical protein